MKLNIIINNSESQVKSTSKEVDSLLFQNLRYKDQAVEYSLQKCLKKLQYLSKIKSYKQIAQQKHILKGLEEKLYVDLYQDGTFPTGLLTRVLNLLEDNGIPFEVQDQRVKPKKRHKFVLKEQFPPLRYYQKDCAKLFLEHDRGAFELVTGAGKTVLLANVIWQLGVNTLIITPSKSITDMMQKTMEQHFGKSKVAKLNTKSVKTKPINICNIQALIKLKPEVLKDIEAVFIDEAHRQAASTYLDVNKNMLHKAYFRGSLSATYFRNDGADMGLEAFLAEVLYRYSPKQAFEDGFLTVPEFRIVDNFVQEESSWQKTYKTWVVENEDRNNTIQEIAESHIEDSTLILVKYKEHGEILQKKIPHAAYIHGDEKMDTRGRIEDDFRKGKVKCLIATTGVAGEGVDYPIAKVLIQAGGGKSAIQVIQNVGRVLRLFPNKNQALVYDFSDTGNTWLEKHSNLRQEIYKSYS